MVVAKTGSPFPEHVHFEHLEARIFESTVEQAKRSSVVQLTAPLLPGSVKICRRLYISPTALMREDDIN
jgi:hypothetical protein